MSQPHATIEKSTASDPQPEPRILVIEDHPDIMLLYCRWLAMDGWKNIAKATNGKDAFLMIQECISGKMPPPDIIICDYDLKSGAIWGNDILRLAKKSFPEASMFMISSGPDEHVYHELKELGIPLFQKPINMGVFRALIEESAKRVMRT